MTDPSPSALVDWSVLDRLAEEMADPGIVDDVLDRYLGELPRRLSAVAAALADRDPGELRAAAHALRGSSATVGATALAEHCRAIEIALAQGHLDAGWAAATTAVGVAAVTERALRDRRHGT